MISGRRLFGRSHLLTFRSKQRQQSSFDTQQIDLITRWILGSSTLKSTYLVFLLRYMGLIISIGPQAWAAGLAAPCVVLPP